MSDCIFCKIINGDFNTEFVYENEFAVVFKDINPKAIDIYKIKDGELGVVNINNMIPTPIEELTEVLPTIEDKKYKKMLEEQLTFLNNHKAELFKKINFFQNMYRKGHLSKNILDRCCQFVLLEQKCSEYQNI